MGFKSEAANVKSKIASGSYKEKTDKFAGFFDELTYGIKKQDEAKRLEDKEKRQEARLEKRQIKKDQDEADKIEKSQNSLANLYFTTSGQDSTAQNKAKVLGVIKDGGITNIANLNTLMNKTSQYVDGTVPSMKVAPGEVPFNMLSPNDATTQTNEILKQEKSKGTIEFGPQTEAYDLGNLRDYNWQGVYQQLLAKNDTVNAEKVKEWAVGQQFFEIVPNYTTKELMAFDGDTGIAKLKEIQNTTPTDNVEAQNHLKGIIAVKEITLENSNAFNNPEELITMPLDQLQMAQALYPVTTLRGKNIAAAITNRQSLDNTNNMAELSKQFAKSPEYYEGVIENIGILDTDDPYYNENVVNLSKLITLKSIAIDKVNRTELDTDKGRTVKEQALRAFYLKEGYFVPDNKNNVKIPTTQEMANFEVKWKTLIDISDKPDKWFSDVNLLKMPVEDLKVIIDTGILDGRAEALQTATAMYDSRVEQAETTKLSEVLDPTGKSFNSTVELDAFLASVGPAKMTEDALADYARVRAVLSKQEGIIAEGRDINAYQMAFKEHLAKSENQNLEGDAFINMVTDWETAWKNDSAKTPTKEFNTEFVAGKINEAKTLLRSDNPVDVAKGQAFMDTELPDMMSALTAVSGTALQQEAKLQFLLDSGVDTEVANALVSGTAIVTKDAITGAQTLTNFDSFGITAPADIQAPVQIIGLDIQGLMRNGFTTTINGEEVTFTPEELAESVAFMKNEEKSSGNLDVRKAFGSGSFLKWFAAEAGGLVGLSPFEGLTQMQTHIQGLNNAAMRTISVAIAGSRDSVFNKDAINDTLPKPATLLENKIEAKSKLIGTVNQLKRIMDAQNATFNGRTTPEAKSKAFIQLQALEPLYNSYSRLLAAWEAGETASKVSLTPNLQLTDTVNAGNNDTSLTRVGEDNGIPVYSFGGQ